MEIQFCPSFCRTWVLTLQGKKTWLGVFYSKNPWKIFGSKITQHESGENGTMRVGDRIILKETLKKKDRRAWTGFIWLRTGPCSGLLRTK